MNRQDLKNLFGNWYPPGEGALKLVQFWRPDAERPECQWSPWADVQARFDEWDLKGYPYADRGGTYPEIRLLILFGGATFEQHAIVAMPFTDLLLLDAIGCELFPANERARAFIQDEATNLVKHLLRSRDSMPPIPIPPSES